MKNTGYKAIKTRLKLDKDQLIFLQFLMHASKNLYNEALYNVRQHFFNTNMYLTYQDNYHLLIDGRKLKSLNQSCHKRMSHLSSARPN